MTAFPDTSFLCAIYRQRELSNPARRHFEALGEPLPVTALVAYEFEQGVRYEIFRHSRDRSLGYGEGEGMDMLARWDADLERGRLLRVEIDFTSILRKATLLSEKHTLAHGHRAFDILHVATALHLGARDFLTFDANQRGLAEIEGLATPF